MITDEEFDIIVGGYCRKIKKICDEACYATYDEVLKKAAEINKLASRAQEIKSMQKAQKPTGEKNGTAAQ